VSDSSPPTFAAVLRNRPYVKYLLMANLSAFGYSVYAISIVWFGYKEAGGLLSSAGALAAEYGAYTLTFLFGPLVDKAKDKRSMFLLAFPAQVGLVVVTAIEGEAGRLTFPSLLALVIGVSLLWDIAWVAMNVVPRMLLSKDELFAARGVSGIFTSLNTLGGYGAGAVAIVWFGPVGGVWFYALALAVSSILALLNPLRGAVSKETRFWASMKEGWKVILVSQRDTLLGLSMADIVRGFFFAAPALLMVVISSERFGGSGVAYAAFAVSFVLGSMTSNVLWGKLNPRNRIGPQMILGLLGVSAVLLVMIAVPHSVALVSTVWYLAGFSVASFSSARFTYIKAKVPVELLGRVSGNMYVFVGVTSALGAIWLAQFAQSAPLTLALLVVSGGFATSSLVLALQPKVRRLAY